MADLEDIGAVGTGLDRLHASLTDPVTGVFSADKQRTRILRDPSAAREVFDEFFWAVQEADDVLLVYYAGHGLLDRFGKLHLAVRESNRRQPIGNSVDFARLKESLETANANIKILILDCCYSGQAVGRQSAPAPMQDAVEAAAQVVESSPSRGTFILTSSDYETVSNFVSGESATVFTGALLQALQPREGRETHLGELYSDVRDKITSRRFPEPQSSIGNSCGDLIMRLPATGEDELSPAETPNKKRNSRIVAAVSTVLVVGLVAAVGLAVALTSRQEPSQPTIGRTAPSVAATTSVAPVDPAPVGIIFADDFSGSSLDPQKWDPASDPDVIRPVDGHLLISTRPGVGIDEARLYPLPLLRSFSNVQFTITTPPYAQGGQGGGAFIVNPDGDQPQILTFGPSPSGASIYPLTCDEPRCQLGVYEDFTEAVDTNAIDVAYSEPIAIEIIRRDGQLQYFANKIPIGASAIDPGDLTGFRFNASAGSNESWDVQIDDLVVR